MSLGEEWDKLEPPKTVEEMREQLKKMCEIELKTAKMIELKKEYCEK